MLYDEVYIGKVVCLKCGAKVDVDSLAVIDVGNLEDIPDEVKARGSFFQTLACPACKKSLFLGFVAESDKDEEPKVEKSKPKRRRRKSKKIKAEVEVEKNEETSVKSGIRRSEDGTIDLEGSVNRLPARKAVCSQCKKEYGVGTQDMMAFGSKCPDCMRKLVAGA